MTEAQAMQVCNEAGCSFSIVNGYEWAGIKSGRVYIIEFGPTWFNVITVDELGKLWPHELGRYLPQH